MNLVNCNNLVTLDDEELKNCNGGGTANKVIKDLLPTTIYYPVPDKPDCSHL